MNNGKKIAGKRAKPEPARQVIAITGTSGFVGSSLLRELDADPKVKRIIALDKRKPPFENRKTVFYRIDLTETLADAKIAEILAREECSTFIHSALPVTPMHDVSYAHELQSIGTMYALDACIATKVKKFILASPTDVYGARATNPNYLDEKAPLLGGANSRFVGDKVDVEKQVERVARKHPEMIITVLRPCTILGPRVRNFKTTLLARPVVFTVMGYDPLFQFVHEDDVVRAFRLVIDKDYPGVYNIVGSGVIPMSKALKIAGKISIPVVSSILYPASQLLWYVDVSPAPAGHLHYLKYLCVADGERARRVLNFAPKYSTKEALMAFVGAERLRQAHLM